MKPDAIVSHRLPAGADSDVPSDWWIRDEPGPMPRHELLKRAGGAKGLLCMLVDQIDAELIGACPRLEAISQMAVGVDNVDLEAATAAGIAVGHTPDVLTETTADTAFALLAAAVRRIPEGQKDLRGGAVGEWDPDHLLGGDLHGTTLGVVGFGRIGQAIARRGSGFGMRILYSGPRDKPNHLGAERVPLEALLSVADHVVIAAPLTVSTRHMFDTDALGKMRPGATLVNIARGGLIDHEALTEVAGTGRIRVALDVTDPEPLPNDHPLLHMDNVIVIPHLGSASVRTRRAMARLAIENLVLGLAGKRLKACANPEVYG